MSKVISCQLKRVSQRNNISQVFIAESLRKPKTTINDYFKGKPAPSDFIETVAVFMDDSEFSTDMAHEVYGTLPSFDTDIFQENPLALDILQKQQSEERKRLRDSALLILTKNDAYITKIEREQLQAYVNEFLDELLVEMKIIMLLLNKCGKSLMTAVKERKPYWVEAGYLRKGK